MPDDFPQFDVPSSVPSDTSTVSAPSSAEAAPVAAPEPKVEVAPLSDPLWAPLSAQREREAAEAAPEAEPAAEPAPQTPQAQGTPLEQAVLAQGQVLAALAERLTAPPPQPAAAPKAPVQRDPKSVAIEQALIKHVPQLAPLIAALQDPNKAAALNQILEAAPQHQQAVSQFYADFAEQTVTKLTGGYVEAYGLDPKAVDATLEGDLSEQFQLWVTRPGNERMLQRYEMGDIRVVDAFNDHFVRRFVAPAKRQGQATVAARGNVVAGLPRGGGSSIPTPQQSAPVAPQGERDVFGEAWTELAGKRVAG